MAERCLGVINHPRGFDMTAKKAQQASRSRSPSLLRDNFRANVPSRDIKNNYDNETPFFSGKKTSNKFVKMYQTLEFEQGTSTNKRLALIISSQQFIILTHATAIKGMKERN